MCGGGYAPRKQALGAYGPLRLESSYPGRTLSQITSLHHREELRTESSNSFANAHDVDITLRQQCRTKLRLLSQRQGRGSLLILRLPGFRFPSRSRACDG